MRLTRPRRLLGPLAVLAAVLAGPGHGGLEPVRGNTAPTASPVGGVIADGPPSKLTNARLEPRPLAGSLAEAVRSEGRGPAWLGYAVASLRRGHMCCFDSWSEGTRHSGCCRLEKVRGASSVSACGPATVVLEPSSEAPPVALVLLRVENGRVSRVGAYSKNCGLDAGGLRVLWLTGVPARDSLAVLEPVVGAEAHSLAEEALAAVAA
ncbi:MAG TPA: hypothetical protein VIZ31_03270, partial [Vicinamibacteria bacterium]